MSHLYHTTATVKAASRNQSSSLILASAVILSFMPGGVWDCSAHYQTNKQKWNTHRVVVLTQHVSSRDLTILSLPGPVRVFAIAHVHHLRLHGVVHPALRLRLPGCGLAGLGGVTVVSTLTQPWDSSACFRDYVFSVVMLLLGKHNLIFLNSS